MTQTTHPEHDEERESLVRWIVDIAQAFAEDKPVATFPVDEVRKRIAAHTAKAVEEAERAARLDELGNMTFIDRDGAQTFMPFTQYRCTKDGLLLSWEDRIAQLTTPNNTSNTLEDEVTE